MQVGIFIQQLQDPTPKTRALAAGVIGLVEELRAFDAIKAAFPKEAHPDARQMLDWAGNRLLAAHQRGYDTFEDLLERFGVNRDIRDKVQANLSEREAELLRRVAASVHNSDQMKMNAGSTMGRAMIGYAMGGMAGAALHALSDVRASLFHDDAPTFDDGPQRALPQMPTTNDFTAALRELYKNPNAYDRQRAVVAIGRAHNLDALPYLVMPFIKEQDTETRASIQNVARGLYLGAWYYQLSQDGKIAREIEKRAAQAQQEVNDMSANEGSGAQAIPQENKQASPEEIAAMLRKAEAKKRKRRR